MALAHAGVKRLSWDEYELLSADAGVKDIGYSVIIGNAMGDNFNKMPTELRYGDAAYADLTFNTQMEFTFVTDADTFTDTFILCGIWDGDAVAYRQTMLLSREYTDQVVPVIYGETDGSTPPVGNGYIDCVMMMPAEWNIEKQAVH